MRLPLGSGTPLRESGASVLGNRPFGGGRELGNLADLSKRRLRRLLVAFNVLAIGLALAAIAVIPTGTRLVVIASPWSEPGHVLDIVMRAGGMIVDTGSADWIIVAEGEGGDFAARLMAAGAMLVLDGRLAKACLNLGAIL